MPSSPPAASVAARAAGCRPRRPLPRPTHPHTSGRGSPRPSLPRPARRPPRRPRVLGPLRAVCGRSHPPRGARGRAPFPLPRPLSAGRAGAARRAAPCGRFPPAPPCLRRSLSGRAVAVWGQWRRTSRRRCPWLVTLRQSPLKPAVMSSSCAPRAVPVGPVPCALST